MSDTVIRNICNRNDHIMSAVVSLFSDFGSVKTEHYTYRFEFMRKKYGEKLRHSIYISDVILWALCVFFVAVFIIALRQMFTAIRETLTVKREVQAFITGETMLFERKRNMYELTQRGIGLKFKMILFTSLVILSLMLFVTVPIGLIVVRMYERTLAEKLEARISVLSESLAAGVKNYMPFQNIAELDFLLSQSESVPEIAYTTILGLPADNSHTNVDCVWASNDPDIGEKIDTQSFIAGISRFTDKETDAVAEHIPLLNTEAEKQAGKLVSDIAALSAEDAFLALKSDNASLEHRNEIRQVTARLERTLTRTLTGISQSASGFFPEFNAARLAGGVSNYLFYKPVLYHQDGTRNYVHAVILLKIHTAALIQSVNKKIRTIVFMSSLIALTAILVGSIGAFVFAARIIAPLRRLISHIAMIRDTGDKTKLAGKDIPVTTGDEIGLLSENVNDMTRSLVEAAVNKNVFFGGKEVQRAFLPLDEIVVGGKRIKQSVGRMDTPHIQFFGYYEGAKGVSGDYFDFRKLDDKHFAVIKVDVSGKGSPAALIMAEVAALFTDYFTGRLPCTNGADLPPLVYKINDHLVNRNLFGKFAAFTLAVFDSEAGDFYFCNAGDNLIHIYDASEAKKKTITLTPTPTAGAFPSDLVKMKGGYPVEKVHLDSGDILFLYTDGIEESKRLYRDDAGGALKFRGETDIPVTPEEEAGYKAYIKLCGEQMRRTREKSYCTLVRNMNEDLFIFLEQKLADTADPKKYLENVRRPKLRLEEYAAYRAEKGESIDKTEILSYIKKYDRLITSPKLVHFIKKMPAYVYDYIIYMGQKGASIVDGEEMTSDRVADIIEAVFRRKTYTLKKCADPLHFSQFEKIEFDFSDCTGSPEDAVMALVAAEKLFRMYKKSDANEFDYAVADKKIDAFLKKHFVQYGTYCSKQTEHFQSGLRDEYMFYTHILEDEQFDDLTLVGIKKK